MTAHNHAIMRMPDQQRQHHDSPQAIFHCKSCDVIACTTIALRHTPMIHLVFVRSQYHAFLQLTLLSKACQTALVLLRKRRDSL